MRFILINPDKQLVGLIEADDLQAAQRVAGLNNVDHGIVRRFRSGNGVGLVVFEFGLFEEPGTIRHFGLMGRMYAGNAVLYAFDEAGETIDYPDSLIPGANDNIHPVVWLPTPEDCELAFTANVVARPEMRSNGALIWQWPGPAPFDIPADRRAT